MLIELLYDLGRLGGPWAGLRVHWGLRFTSPMTSNFFGIDVYGEHIHSQMSTFPPEGRKRKK